MKEEKLLKLKLLVVFSCLFFSFASAYAFMFPFLVVFDLPLMFFKWPAPVLAVWVLLFIVFLAGALFHPVETMAFLVSFISPLVNFLGIIKKALLPTIEKVGRRLKLKTRLEAYGAEH